MMAQTEATRPQRGVNDALEVVASRHADWSAAARSLAGVERLVERQRAARAAAVARAEQRDLDEVAALRHTRGKR